MGVITNNISAHPPISTTATIATTTETTIETLCDRVDHLAGRASLRPDATVNELFSHLVGTIVRCPDPIGRAVLADHRIRARTHRFRAVSATGETELERAWAARICAGPRPHDELEHFPYLDNYRRLVRVEAGALTAALIGPAAPIAFLGAGPLPLSAILLGAELGAHVDGYDHDPAAVTQARAVAEHLGASGVRVLHGDATDVDLSGYRVVVAAALVGDRPAEKARILGRVRASMTPGALLLIRGARGLRTLLYPPVDDAALRGFDVLTVIHPVNDIVNSVIVARAVCDR